MAISKLINQFRDSHVDLTQDQLADIRQKREANLKRLKSGLKVENGPEVAETINQGGYAMGTMTQQPEADEETRWDIDMGVVFLEEDKVGARRTRQRVCDALAHKSGNLSKPPELKNKCVRISYSDGYQVDFPVFYKSKGGKYYVSISDEWVESDPVAINKWFEERVKTLSPENSGYQLRRIVRLVKYFCKVRALVAGKMPSGLLATALTVENYVSVDGDDAASFKATLEKICTRLVRSKRVFANGIEITNEKDEPRLQRLEDACSRVGEWLDGIDDETQPAKVRASWKKVFRHSFFDSNEAKKYLGEGIAKASIASAVAAPETKAIAEGSRPWAN